MNKYVIVVNDTAHVSSSAQRQTVVIILHCPSGNECWCWSL